MPTSSRASRITGCWRSTARSPAASRCIPYPEEGKAELACLYVSKTQENAGYGRKLMTFVENLARNEGFKEMFALSTQAFVYLQQKGGFHEADADALPAARREKYAAERAALEGARQAADWRQLRQSD